MLGRIHAFEGQPLPGLLDGLAAEADLCWWMLRIARCIMHAAMQTTESAELPFIDSQPTSREGRDTGKEWFLSLRHAHIPFHPQDRLVLLYGHSLVFRLGLYAATERVLAGEPVVYLDGANTFDPFFVGRLARAYRRQPRSVLAMIHVARAFTCHQMERLVSDCLKSALDQYQSHIAVLSGLFDTLYDGAVPESEGMRLFGRMMEASQRLAQQGYTVLFLCPHAPVLTRTNRRCLDQLRGQADRVIRVHEEQGLVKLQEEGEAIGQSWEIPRTALDVR
jgi:hypothetical protein